MLLFDEESMSLDDVSVASYGLVGSAIFLVAIVAFRIYDSFFAQNSSGCEGKEGDGGGEEEDGGGGVDLKHFAYDLAEDLMYGIAISVGAFYTLGFLSSVLGDFGDSLDTFLEGLESGGDPLEDDATANSAAEEFNFLEGGVETASTVAL